ncbi:S9 family peptidase [Chitinophaga silvisoli]|uniref:Acyl-peptide hydrolase n=1 Tax=Chitinophaga silvisoli TaxID=2291814 RepID=A0A3E1P8R4_9BACT|nr:alpha/beta fold hydrolase [Chitinophaga silvisoli]RFM36544.1 S9 family peptidase [Chitinophaga silvisoli]
MRKPSLLTAFYLCFASMTYGQHYSMEAITGYPFPSELTPAAQGSKVAWAVNEQGKRNVYVATGPDFSPRKLSNYTQDDGQEITSLSISDNGKWVVYTRGGDHSGKDGFTPVNPTHDPIPPKTEIWSVPFEGGTAKVLSEGDYPAVSPHGDSVAFIKGGQAYIIAIDGSAPPRVLFSIKGNSSSLEWSPDGSKIAFVSDRNGHSFIGVYTSATAPIQWISPGFAQDNSPRWSPDGTQIAFVRTPGTGGAPDSILARRHKPWEIRVANISEGNSTLLWKAPATLSGSIPTTDGATNLHWGANNSVTFLSYHDGWPHLYSIPGKGGTPLLLTPGNFMCEQISLTADKKWLVFSANNGPSPQDIDRRHIARVPVDKAAMEMLTTGDGIETYPVVTGDGQNIILFTATAQQPLLTAKMPFGKGKPSLISASLLPKDFPAAKLITPTQVIFKAPDGTPVHAQLYQPAGGPAKKPAIVYVHGGPQRQMVLGWHWMDYYSIDYALNQYLVDNGFIVLAINYRLGIGYGYEFHKPANAGVLGASEYQDVKAAGEWLAAQSQVDPKRIGIYGGSYGGFLTAHALGRDSRLFAAGVDIHGVHNRSQFAAPPATPPAPDADTAEKVALLSSPVAYVDTWTSPVLLIHADDDRNVNFNQSIDLINRLEKKGVNYETLSIPDDTHHWMKYSNELKVNKAAAEFLIRQLGK